jgi:glycerophosphoryl diester phosphodiesterase
MTRRPLSIAHRGASGDYPENTLTAIQKAIEAGADMVEIDIHRTCDGRLVVLHDEDLHRTAGVRARVSEMSLKELKGLDVGKWRGDAFQGERIPTLSEVFSLVKGKVRLDVEIKTSEPGVEDLFLDEVRQCGMEAEVLASSFDWEVLRRIRRADAGLPIGLLCETWKGALAEASTVRASAVVLSQRRANASMIAAAHDARLDVWIYTVNDAESMRKCLAAGVDGICTDFPERLTLLLRELLPLC